MGSNICGENHTHTHPKHMFCFIVLDGENHPLGVIVDFFRRVEFQMRGTPHYHILVSVKRDSVEKTDIESSVPEIKKKVTDLVKTVITANLVEPVHSETVPYVFYNSVVNDEPALSLEEEKVPTIYLPYISNDHRCLTL